MKRKQALKVVMVLVLVVAAVGLTQLGGKAGAAGGSVKLSFCPDLSGPYGVLQRHIFQGWKDYLDYVNEELGGVKGHRVEYKWGDSHMEIAKELAFYEEAKSWGTMIHACGYTGGALALKDKFKRDKIPQVGVPANAALAEPDSYSYMIWGIYEDQVLAQLKWFIDNKPKEMTNKAAYIHIDNAAGRAPCTDKAYAYAKQIIGADVVLTKFMPPAGGVDTTPILNEVKNAGANFVASVSVSPSQATLLKDASRLGIMARKPFQAGKIMFCDMPATERDLVRLIGNDVEGMMYVTYGVSFDEDLKGVQFAKDLQIKRRGKVDSDDPMYFLGLTMARIHVKALERTLDKLPYEQLNGEVIKKHGLDGLTLDSDVWSDVDFTKGTYGAKKVRVYIVQDLKAKPAGGWLANPDLYDLRK